MLEAPLQKGKNILFIVYCFTLLLNHLLFFGQLFDAVCDLISNFRKILSDFFIVLQHKDVLVYYLKEDLSEFFDFLCIDDILFEELL